MDELQLPISDFTYHLPDERIAKFPLENRDNSKLLIYKNGNLNHDVFCNLPDYLTGNNLLVFNNTRVIRARLNFVKSTGSHIEIFCLEPFSPADYYSNLGAGAEVVWKCMVGNLKKWKNSNLEKSLLIQGKSCVLSAEKVEVNKDFQLVKFSWNSGHSFAEILEAAGEIPIPPYLNRQATDNDSQTYQTIYSRINGSVAAPTAGLHFTPAVINQLQSRGNSCAFVTLHVGAGTFAPVKASDATKHVMHSEHFIISRAELECIHSKIGSIIPVGTTSLRTLESLYWLGAINQLDQKKSINQWDWKSNIQKIAPQKSVENILAYMQKNSLQEMNFDTQIMITPGYQFNMIQGIITNFHQPQSTLLLLISAIVGEDWKSIYQYAMENNFRFLSYGDSSLLWCKS